MSMISPPAKGRNGLQSYCKFPERPNFWPKIFRKFFQPPKSAGSFQKAGAKLLPLRDMTKFFRNFFREIFRFFRNTLIASRLQKHPQKDRNGGSTLLYIIKRTNGCVAPIASHSVRSTGQGLALLNSKLPGTTRLSLPPPTAFRPTSTKTLLNYLHIQKISVILPPRNIAVVFLSTTNSINPSLLSFFQFDCLNQTCISN